MEQEAERILTQITEFPDPVTTSQKRERKAQNGDLERNQELNQLKLLNFLDLASITLQNILLMYQNT